MKWNQAHKSLHDNDSLKLFFREKEKAKGDVRLKEKKVRGEWRWERQMNKLLNSVLYHRVWGILKACVEWKAEYLNFLQGKCQCIVKSQNYLPSSILIVHSLLLFPLPSGLPLSLSWLSNFTLQDHRISLGSPRSYIPNWGHSVPAQEKWDSSFGRSKPTQSESRSDLWIDTSKLAYTVWQKKGRLWSICLITAFSIFPWLCSLHYRSSTNRVH